MFRLKVADAKLLRDMTTAISILVDEATFKIDQEGIKLRAMDPSRVAMVDFEWPKTVFDEYECTEPTKMCINISELLKLLRRAGKDEFVELSLDEKTGRLQVKITGKYTRNFTMPTLEASEEEVPTPKITFNVKAKVTTEGLTRAIEDAQLVSDHVRIEAKTGFPRGWRPHGRNHIASKRKRCLTRPRSQRAIQSNIQSKLPIRNCKGGIRNR